MKLVFPNGEHAQALLGPGINRIGSAPDCDVVLIASAMPGVALEIHVLANSTHLVPKPGALLQVNGKPVGELMALRIGDRINIDGVETRLAAIAAAAGGIAKADAAGDGDSATRMIAAVPKHVLRGLNGSCFGKQFPVAKTIVIGRSPECDIVLDLPEISRRHAQLRPIAGGVAVEDLGSSNGIWINDRQMAQGILRPGDELRLDAIRFTLTTPTAAAPSFRSATTATARGSSRTRIATWIAIAAAIVAIAFLIGAAI